MIDYDCDDLLVEVCNILRLTRFERTACHVCGVEFTAAYTDIAQLKTATCGGWGKGCIDREELGL